MITNVIQLTSGKQTNKQTNNKQTKTNKNIQTKTNKNIQTKTKTRTKTKQNKTKQNKCRILGYVLELTQLGSPRIKLKLHQHYL